ncbi:hypothetical protein AXF42_Ash021606 [Apostasia shenzhenica]|uniref:Uncharacterized protein n=1 Tax=Apostasia shenzhenica TaxID=1088818 RepID=A0A2H9ZVM4_9ASPA|nr:hypothetical protein AXF42_Ash021606 [Apostasia shenzhenica]
MEGRKERWEDLGMDWLVIVFSKPGLADLIPSSANPGTGRPLILSAGRSSTSRS